MPALCRIAETPGPQLHHMQFLSFLGIPANDAIGATAARTERGETEAPGRVVFYGRISAKWSKKSLQLHRRLKRIEPY